MKRILLTISYDGTDYHGWQVQPNGITVQQVLQDSLQKIIKTRPAVTGCSRTDAGVHAKEFCCHLDCDSSLPDEAFLRGLNSVLPSDIAVTGCKIVPDDFHARYFSKGKNYIYRIYNSNIKNPFIERYALKIDRKINLEKINNFCKCLEGKHDFAAFSSSGRTVEDTVRTVSECYADRDGDIVSFHITADGFLYNMVRIIVGTALMVSDGKILAEDTEKMFKTGNRSLAGPTVPPQGLFLNKVLY